MLLRINEIQSGINEVNMRYGIVFFALLLFIFSNIPASAQEETLLLNSEELDPHRRSTIVFQHERHAEAIDCARCHHDPDRYGANTNIEGEGQRCAECHKSPENPFAPTLMKAFHVQCKGCHKKLMQTTDLKPPRLCGQCHLKQP